MEPNFSQSPAWERLQKALGKPTFRDSGDGWEYLAILERGGGLQRLYCPYGPTVTSVTALDQAIESLTNLAKKHNIAYLRLEPLGVDFAEDILDQRGLRQIEYAQPAYTWRIDLTQNEEDIVKQMNQNNRSIYRNYAKKGLSYHQSQQPGDITKLTSLLKEVAKHNDITVHPDTYFATEAETLLPAQDATLHYMQLGDQVVAAALVLNGDETCYYAHAAASHEHRKLNASTALLAEIIIDAKHRGKKICDLYGISSDHHPNPRWDGFTKFKKSFGGYEVKLSYTYDLPIKKTAYRLYNLSRSAYKQLRR